MATGVAWTEAGGDIMVIEAALMPGNGDMQLTGQLGEVMRESGQAALTYARARADVFDISVERFEESDIHIHIPEGAIPKDGPSAGVTMTVALISALTRCPSPSCRGRRGAPRACGAARPRSARSSAAR